MSGVTSRERVAGELRNWLRYVDANLTFGRILASYGWIYLLYRLFGYERIARRLERAHDRNSTRALEAILRLKAVFIKLGQVVSVLGGILPAVFSEKLGRLQDQVPPVPYDAIALRFREEFGKDPEELGLAICESPLASASLGQVHRATSSDGRDLAIKVQYPDIEKIVEMDLKVLRRITWCLDLVLPEFHYHRISDQVVDVIRRELDYQSEARNLQALARNFVADPDVLFPELVEEYTTGRVLCMTYMHGIKIGDRKALIAAGIDPSAVVKKLVETFFKQLLQDRLFHADPHPGNFLVRPGPQLVFLDFGAVEPVRESLMRGMAKVFMGYMTRNDALVLEGVEIMGFRSLTGDRALFERAVKHYFEKILRLNPEDVAQLEADTVLDFTDLRQLDIGFRDLVRTFEYPEGYFYIERSLFLLLGLCLRLDKRADPLMMGAPYAMQHIFAVAADPAAGRERA